MKKIAFLLIHGIGEQEPFETMDAFVRPFYTAYSSFIKRSHPSAKVELKHCLTKFPQWVESYVAVIPSVPDFPEIHIYEYYWAYMTERQISMGEVCQWMVGVAKGAKKFYDRQDKTLLKDRPKNDVLFTKDGEFRDYKYLARLFSYGNFLQFIYIAFSPFLLRFKWMENIFKFFLKGPLEKFVGDIAVYCSTDKKSKYYEARARILTGAKEKFKVLLHNDTYEEVFLIGHSLGTVVSYDTLARLNRECNVDADLCKKASKIKGLVTFGSPLDKIAFFFDDHIPEEQFIRQTITSQLYGFRRVDEPATILESGMKQNFEDLLWLNFWSPTDPVSGFLNVYRKVNNIQMDFSKNIRPGINSGLDSHCQYWKSPEMYNRIIESFIP